MGKLGKPLLIRIVVIILAISLGIFCTFQLKQYLFLNTPKDTILVAATDIMPNTIITPDIITQTQLPAGSKMTNALQNPNDVVGKKSATVIYKGEQFLTQKVAEQHIVTNPGERVLSIPIDLVKSVGMTVKPGDNIDVYWLPDSGKSILGNEVANEAIAVAYCATVLELRSKNSSTSFDVVATPETAENEQVSNRSEVPSVAVIKVKEEETKALFTAIGNGRIYLAKRPLSTN